MEDEGAGEECEDGDCLSEGRINRAFIVFLKQMYKSFLRIGKIIFSRSHDIKNPGSCLNLSWGSGVQLKVRSWLW